MMTGIGLKSIQRTRTIGMKYRLLSVFLLLVCISLTSCAGKQTVKPEEQPVAPAAEELKLPDTERGPEMKAVPPPVQPVEKKPDEQYVMLNFENADIGTVINTISEMLKINYILSPGVAGKITIQSQNKVPLSELYATFQTILEFNGFTAIKDGSFYRIVPIDTAKQQPVKIETGKDPEVPKDSSFITQQIPLEYVKANDIANLVRNLMPRGTDIIVYEPSNMLIVTAPPAGIVKTMKLLEAIDIPSTERDTVRTFVYYVENGEAKSLAAILKSLYGKQKAGDTKPVKAGAPGTQPAAPPSTRRTTPAAPAAAPAQTGATVSQEGIEGEIEGDVLFDAYDDINALIIKATPRSYLVLLETLKKLDIQPRQVLIEVLIAEISLTDETSLGLEWLFKGHGSIDGQPVDYIVGNAQTPSTFFGKSGDGEGSSTDLTKFVPVIGSSAGLFANIIDSRNFSVFLNAAATLGNVNVLASPHILGVDNKEAKIEISDEVPVATSISQATTTTDLNTSQVQFKSAGIILTVTPHINEKKQVTLKINQEVSQPGETYLIGGQPYQGFRKRSAITTAIVQDGHTLVIGGIIREDYRNSRSGIPFFSRLPLLGYLFGSSTDNTARSELLLMVTPHVVATHEEADIITEEYKNKVQNVKERITQRQKRSPGAIDTDVQSDVHLHETDSGRMY